MSLELLLAGVLVGALLLFALGGGADFGGGMWTLLARGENAEEHAELVDRAIGPLWETNELWIVVTTVILWAGFTRAFVAFGVALFVPMILVLVGIVLRGAFLAFQEQAEYSPTRRAFEVFGKVFSLASAIAPFFFGMAAGTIASGRLRLESAPPSAGRFFVGTPADGYFAPWLGLFPITIGVLALATCAYLAAVYLTLEADDRPQLQELFRRRGIASGAVLGLLGLGALPVASFDAPYIWRGVIHFPGLMFLVLAALALISSIALLFTRHFWWARTAAILEVVAVFGVWASAQYPYLLVPDITIHSAASPRSVLIALLILSFFYAIILGPSLVLLLTLFKRRPSGRSGEY